MPVYKTKNENTKNKKFWYFITSYNDYDGKRKRYKSKKYLTKSEALDAEAKYKILNGEKTSNITFEDGCILYMENYKNKNKESSYISLENKINNHIKDFFFPKVIEKINMFDIDTWIKKIKDKNLCIVYINDLISLFKGILRYSIIHFNLTTNIVEKITHIKKPIGKEEEVPFWTDDNFNYFIKSVNDLELKTLFTLLYFTGIRIGEALALKWNDIKNGSLDINKTINLKTFNGGYSESTPKTNNSYRDVSVPIQAMSLLNRWNEYCLKTENFNNSYYIFGIIRPLVQTTLRRQLKDLIKYYNDKANEKERVPVITFKGFRHSHVSLLISLGCNDYEIAARLGHTVEMVRNTYSHLFPKNKDKILDKLNKI